MSLRIFHDNMETSIRGLETLGQPQKTFGALLTPVLFRKLLAEVRTNLTREHGNDKWDIATLRQAITKELHAQEAGKSDIQDSDSFTPTASLVTTSTPSK